MLRSLKARFVVASLLLLPALIGISAYSLDIAFQRSLLSGESERIKSHIYLLLGAAELIDGELWMPEQLAEPRLTQAESGLYGFIVNENNVFWRSPSAQLFQLELESPTASKITPGATEFSISELYGKNYFSYYQDIAWEKNKNESLKFRFLVYHAQTEYLAELSAYRKQLWRWLAIIVISIFIAQMIILRWGLKPLQHIASDLDRIKSGETDSLFGSYPDEIQPITDNLNQLLKSERDQRLRYRNTMDDLAHSLKTPLAVIKSLLHKSTAPINNGNDLADQQECTTAIEEQIDRMNQIVGHQLKRAAGNQHSIHQEQANIASIIERVGASLAKVYKDKKIIFDYQIVEDTFFGDERDMFELIGNLLENACKYCHRQIGVVATKNETLLSFSIEDDGKGVPEEKRSIILQRGERADTVTPGQGIGLAVCVDIVSSYKGGIAIEQSSLGGAKFVVTLPLKTAI